MTKLSLNQALPYPRNLIAAVFGEEHVPVELPHDIEETIEYLFDDMREWEARALRLRYMYGQSIKDIAWQYGVTTACICQRIRRGERMLRESYRACYLRMGYAAAVRDKELRRQRLEQNTKELEECIRNTLPSERFSGPLKEIPDGRDRVDTILARCGIDTVDVLGASTRVYNTLLRRCINDIWELCFVKPDELLQVKYVGVRQVAEIERLLARYNLSLDDGTLSADPTLRDYAEHRLSMVKKRLEERETLQRER